MSYRVTVTGDLALKEGVTKEQIDEIVQKGLDVFDEVEAYNQGIRHAYISIYECQESYWHPCSKAEYKEDCEDFYKAVSKYLKDGEINFRGEDGEVWKHTFDGEKWQEYTGKVVFTSPTVFVSPEQIAEEQEEECLER